jgi:hypothetical protein
MCRAPDQVGLSGLLPPCPTTIEEMTEERPIEVDFETRRAALVRELSTRLRPLCADWPDDLFGSMVDGLAAVTMKYEGSASPSTYDRRTTDRLVADLRDALSRNEDARGDQPESD